MERCDVTRTSHLVTSITFKLIQWLKFQDYQMYVGFTNVLMSFWHMSHVYNPRHVQTNHVTLISPAWQLQPITSSIDLRFQRNIYYLGFLLFHKMILYLLQLEGNILLNSLIIYFCFFLHIMCHIKLHFFWLKRTDVCF